MEDFNLGKWLAQEAARDKLTMAGYRGQAPYITFLFFRLVTPIVLFLAAILYVFVISHMEKSMPIKIGMCVGAAYLGLQAPMLFLKNAITKRQLSIKRAFPDALDLLLICIESGMSIEVAFRKVSTEIVTQSIALSEEFTLTTAELSYLQDRKVAYENLAKRTGLEGVKSVCLALQQSERYGTPLGQSLRVMAQENRDMRMNEAEKKAAALPPKLTVPMILFFLPVLFVVILGPTGIKIIGDAVNAATASPADGVDPLRICHRPACRAIQRHDDCRIPRARNEVDRLDRAPDDGCFASRRQIAGQIRLSCLIRRSVRPAERRRIADIDRGWPDARAVLAVQHLLQIGDVRRRLVRRQIGLDDGFGLGEAALQADHQAEILPHPRIRLAAGIGPAQRLLGLRQILGKHVGQAEIGQHRRLVGHDLQGAGVIAARFVMAAELVERGALHRQDAPVGIVGRMGAGEHIERLLEIAVVGQRAAIAGEQRLVAGIGDGGLFEHGDGLGALPGGAQRLAIGQRGVGILGIGAIAFAVGFDRAPRIGLGSRRGIGLRGDRSRDVGHGLAAAEAGGQNRRHGHGRKKPRKTGLLTHAL